MPELITSNGETKLRAKATIGAEKIHGPNSPLVISGQVPLGHREPIEVSEPEQYVELSKAQCADMFGQEKADELFKGAQLHE